MPPRRSVVVALLCGASAIARVGGAQDVPRPLVFAEPVGARSVAVGADTPSAPVDARAGSVPGRAGEAAATPTHVAARATRDRVCRAAFVLAGGAVGTAVVLPTASRMVAGVAGGDLRGFFNGAMVLGGGAIGGAIVGYVVGHRVCHRGAEPRRACRRAEL